MRPLKIIQCCVFYLPNRIGGIEIYISSLGRELKKNGHDIKILVPQYPDEKKYPAEFEQIPILSYAESYNISRNEFKGKVPGKGLVEFIEIIKSENPDIVHFHQISNSNGMSVFHFAEVKTLGIPVVFTIHLLGWENRSLVSKLLELCDSIIVLSDWYSKFLFSKFRINEKIKIIKSALTHNEIPEKQIKGESSILKLVYVGRISPEKGLHLLLKALRTIDERKVVLSIYGQTTDMEYFKKCLQFCKEKSNIKWCGTVDSKGVMKIISNFDFLIVPSIVTEMSPLIILEAFAVGVPVIGSNSGGIAEAINQGENGFLFERGNEAELKSILQKLANNPSIPLNISKQINPPRKFDQVAQETELVYQAVLGNDILIYH